jgi:glycosyl hydrolase family 106( putative alpha-L-rhamnosidase)
MNPRRLCLVLTGLLLCFFARADAQSSTDALRQAFAHPPDDTRVMMRWWWFGPAVTKTELLRELEEMKATGIGGVEVAALYPQSLDNDATGLHNGRYLSDEYIDDLRFAAHEATRLGLRMDLTLGSGWPFGGPAIPVTQAAGMLRVERVPVAPGVGSVASPALESGESLLAVFLVRGEGDGIELRNAQSAPAVRDGRLNLQAEEQPRTALFFIASRTGMTVKRPAIGAEGFVLDHYSDRAIATHLHAVGDRLMQAFDGHPPYAVFSDSLEDYGSDWTPDLLAQFRTRRGYDLTPHLPALVGDAGPETAAIRHDWGRTLTELANEGFLQPMHAWAREHGTLLRSQTYGYPPVTLSSNRLADLPEGEGKANLNMWREFSDTRWAASAGHLFGKNVISSETWTWLHSPAFRAAPLDMKAEADLHFLQGINQLVGHGWPYSPASAGEPGWRMYAAGAFNAHNPWFFAMPDLTKYLQRVSFALRLGKPANDIALLLPNDDVWASFRARYYKQGGGFDDSGSNITMDESMKQFLGSTVIAQVLDAGFNLDFIDADAIDSVGIPYKVLILPGIDRIPVQTYEKIQRFVQGGGIVIATRRLPATAPGFLNFEAETHRIQELSHSMFQSKVAGAHFMEDENHLRASLDQYLEPDFVTTPRTTAIGFIHRKLETGDLYFFANTSNRVQHFSAHFRSARKHAELWDAFSGKILELPVSQDIMFILEPYESRLVLFSDNETSQTHATLSDACGSADVSVGRPMHWSLAFADAPQTLIPLDSLTSWDGMPQRRFYSGRGTYRTQITVPDSDLGSATSLKLSFGEGTPVPIPDPLPEFNMRAYLDSPVRDAAEVFVNGKSAGFVWHPPFQIDITPFVHAGSNQITVLVGNTAINRLAGQPLLDNRLLDARYGVRFTPQDMTNLKPLPSGLLGGVMLVAGRTDSCNPK